MSRAWDPGRSVYAYICGKKGSGKSHLAYTMWSSYPFHRLVLDVTHDVLSDWVRPLGIPHRVITPETIPLRWPQPYDDDEPWVTLVYQPDMGAATAVDDLDRMLGVAMTTKRVCAWVDEIGAITTANSTPPNLRRALHYGRHHDLSLIECGPRSIDVNPLCIAQADIVAAFKIANPADRKRIADNTGIDLREYDRANHALQPHEYLLYDAREDAMSIMPPLPPIRSTPIYHEVPTDGSVVLSKDDHGSDRPRTGARGPGRGAGQGQRPAGRGVSGTRPAAGPGRGKRARSPGL